MASRRPNHRMPVCVAVAAALVLADAGCGRSGEATGAAPRLPTSTAEADALTPLVGSVAFAPIPFAGSDAKTHLVYELSVTNFTNAKLSLGEMKVIDADSGTVIEELDAARLRDRLQPAGGRDSVDHLEAGQSGTVFIHLALEAAKVPPHRLVHEVKVISEAMPESANQTSERLAPTTIDTRKLPVLSAPLSGARYIGADGCCDAVRHTRAILPLNGQTYLAQRYAVDYEQADEQNRIFAGNPRVPESYVIFGKNVMAVADGTVVATRNDLPEQTPGSYPSGIPLDEADGNFVVLDIGGGFYVNYAHMQPGSVRPKHGDRVRRGDVIGLVGNTGNSVAPHLHLHVMDGPSPLAAQGLPFLYDHFAITGQVASTADFDAAEAKGIPLVTVPGLAITQHTNQLILDQNMVTFSP
jgi:Peptidase family M23